MKEDLIAILQDHFKPKSSIEQEKVEYNEINIFSEYQLHNLIYAKNELLLTSPKCALLLHQFWRLLEFNPDAPKGTQDQAEEEAGSNRVSRMNTANPTDQQHAANSEQEFGDLLKHKFDLFKALCMEMINEVEPSLKFAVEEIKRIADYAKDSYFKHLRLYDYVLNNK